MLDVKLTDHMTGHENAGHEIAGHKRAGYEKKLAQK